MPNLPKAKIVIDEETHFISFDGTKLGLQIFGNDDAKAIILAIHGMNDYSEAFYLFGPYMAKNGYKTIAIDLRGFGRSPNFGDWAGLKTYVTDIQALIYAARTQYAGKEIILIGESMGGSLIMASYYLKMKLDVDKIILSAPGVWGWSNMSIFHRLGLWIGDKFIGQKKLAPPQIITKKIYASDNMPTLVKSWNDPLMSRETKPSTAKGLVDAMEAAYKIAHKIGHDTPTLILLGNNDQIVPRHATLKMQKRLNNAVKVIEYPEGYHLLLRDLKREETFEDIIKFIEEK